MRRQLGLVLAVLARHAAGAETASRLQIQIPRELFRENGYEHQEALFGIPKYGGSIAERLLYGGISEAGARTTWTLCSDQEAALFVNPDPSKPFILMVDRGDCTFVTKVRRAQHMGASGVLIADNNCLCDDATCIKDDKLECEVVEPIMADDGSGADITIPSFLMKKPDSEAIKSHLDASQFVQMEMTWSLPAPDDRVEWTLWTSSVDGSAQAFKRDFKDIVVTMGKSTFFQPFYVVYDGNQYGCRKAANHCGNLCTNMGRYCMTDPDFDPNKGVSGADVVTESLRQKCIWKHYGGDLAPTKDQGIGEQWWSYVSAFDSMCGMEKFNDTSCIASAMKKAGVEEEKISMCMSTSGGVTGDTPNTVLEEELNEKSTKTIVIIPTVYVNNVPERGGISTAAVMTTICAGYESGTEPDVCRCAGQSNSDLVKQCVQGTSGGGMGGNVSKGLSAGGVLFLCVGLVITMTTAGYVYWKRTQDNMRDQVRGILAEYMPLEDMDAPGTNARVPFMAQQPPSNGDGGGGTYRGAKDIQLV